MEDRFRSIKAFKKFEEESQTRQRLLEAEPAGESLGLLRVLARVKERPGGVRRGELADGLGVPTQVLHGPLLRLVKEGLVIVRPGAGPDEDVIVG